MRGTGEQLTRTFVLGASTVPGRVHRSADAGDDRQIDLITHVPFKRTDVRHMILSMPSPVPGQYFVMPENGVSGGALQHFLEHVVFASDPFGTLDGTDRYARLQRAVEATPPGSGGLLFLPWMGGSLARAAHSQVRGGFLNLGLDVTRSHLARAGLEGDALHFRWLRGPVERFAKRSFSHVLFYGGGAESDAWSQILADVLGTPVHQILFIGQRVPELL